MTHGVPDDDRRLRELFAALRAEDRRALPAFDRVLATMRHDHGRPSRRFVGSGWFWMEVVAFAAAIVLVLVQFVPRRAPRPDPLAEALAQARAIDAWEAPTDALLEIAILKIPDTVPTLEFESLPVPSLTRSNP